MPIFCFTCPKCGRQVEDFRTMKQRNDPVTCSVCETEMKRDRTRELSHVTGTQKGDTFWSESLAISPSQTSEHRRLFPDVRVDAQGRIGFDSVKQRSDYLDKCGFEKVPGKQSNRKPTPV